MHIPSRFKIGVDKPSTEFERALEEELVKYSIELAKAINKGLNWADNMAVDPATTAGAAATFSQGSGNAVNDASTFDGYTLLQVVKALRNAGILT